MTRTMFGSVLGLSVLGGLAGFTGPTLSTGPGGEAMTVRGPISGTVQAVSFDASDCFPTLLLGEDSIAADPNAPTDLGMGVRGGPEKLMAVDPSPDLSRQSVVILDKSGQVLAAGPAAFALAEVEQAALAECLAADRDGPDAI